MSTIINQKMKKIKEKIELLGKKFSIFITSDIAFYIILLFFVGTASFLLGRFSLYENNYLNQNSFDNKIIIKKNTKDFFSNIKIVASKNGSVYHFPWCAGAIKMKEENKVFFENKKEAEKAGYKAAKNCEGL